MHKGTQRFKKWISFLSFDTLEDWEPKNFYKNRVILIAWMLASLFHNQEFHTMLAQEKFSFLFLNCKYSIELAIIDVVTVVNLVLSNAKINTKKWVCGSRNVSSSPPQKTFLGMKTTGKKTVL